MIGQLLPAGVPLTGRWLDFEQVAISIDPDGAFTARLLVTAIALPA